MAIRHWLGRLRSGWNALRVQLLASYVVLSLAPIGLLGWFMLGSLNQFYEQRVLDDLQVEATLIGDPITADLVNGQPMSGTDVATLSPPRLHAQARVLVFDPIGREIASSGDPATLTTDEPGLGDALRGNLARGIEYSPSLDAPIAFVAQPLYASDQVVGVVYMAYALADLRNELADLRNAILLAMAGLALLAFMISLEYSRRLNTPLDRLRVATRDIAAGHFDHRVAEEGVAELAEVARHFNGMAADLQRVEQQRRMLFANLAHDVRTPLGSIRAAAEALEAGAYDQPELRARLTSGLIAQTAYLRRLTDDMLRLATYEGGGMTLRLQAVSPAALLQQAAQSFAPAAMDQSIGLEVDAAADLPNVTADPDRLLEVLFNLMDNALQYTPAGGSIRLGAAFDPAHRRVTFSVLDTGPGLPKGEEDVMFDPFRRGRLRQSGTGLHAGLGLSIASALVSNQGGGIEARNRKEGGAAFTFWVPTAQG